MYEMVLQPVSPKGMEILSGEQAATNLVPCSRERLCKLVGVDPSVSDEELSAAVKEKGLKVYVPNKTF